MTVTEYAPTQPQILDFINDGIRNLKEGGIEPKYILLGPEAYDLLIRAMGERFRRKEGQFETYQFISIVVDPQRKDTVCVLPGPAEIKNIHIQRVSSSA